MNIRDSLILIFVIGLLAIVWVTAPDAKHSSEEDREEVVFWHFWGGEDKRVVESVVKRFNESQPAYRVRAVAMPGNNLQAKLFLSVAGGDPPDLVNQDDPVLSDWSRRGVIHAIDEIAPESDVHRVMEWMLPSARRLSEVDDRAYAICNGLDIRALYFNKTALDEKGILPPRTIKELDSIAGQFTSIGSATDSRFGYLPDSRRLWAWGFAFGADFYNHEPGQVNLNSPAVVAALTWMKSYPEKWGADRVAAFRQGDQSLPGKAFPLLPLTDDQLIGRYVVVMDGQWRVRDIRAFQESRRKRGASSVEFGVCPLPIPENEVGLKPRQRAGWVNGNFFVVPRGAKNPAGAWQFMKFWIGHAEPAQAAKTCAEGGWIPVSARVIEHEEFQRFLDANPMFQPFVELAASPNQFPIPQVPGAAMFRRTVEDAAYRAMSNPQQPVKSILEEAEFRIQQHLDRAAMTIPVHQPIRSLEAGQ
jgi:multiple sugar transport system substrate-binding protein